jgi:DNA modification methylase
MPKTPARNTLFYGDNLPILREHIGDESVDLVYLDPPFNSNASYNVLFRAPDGHQSQAQIEAFDDTWHWNERAERAFDDEMQSGNSDAAEMLRAMRSFHAFFNRSRKSSRISSTLGLMMEMSCALGKCAGRS